MRVVSMLKGLFVDLGVTPVINQKKYTYETAKYRVSINEKINHGEVFSILCIKNNHRLIQYRFNLALLKNFRIENNCIKFNIPDQNTMLKFKIWKKKALKESDTSKVDLLNK